MSSNPNVLEVPAYGRPFQLGMLYNATNDKLIQGQELWDKDTVQKAQQEKPFVDTQFRVITDDTLGSKFQSLGANNSGLKMNLLAGLVNVSGAALYYTDQKPSREVSRASVHFKCSSLKREVDIQQLGQINNPAVIEATRATHVVSSILYGLEAFLVLDRAYSAEEDTYFIRQTLSDTANFLSSMYDSGTTDITKVDQSEVSKYNFKLHSDVFLTSPCSSFKEFIATLQDQLLKFFREGSSCTSLVPKRVWLHPLANIESSAPVIVHQISDGVVSQAEKLIEELVEARVWLEDIKKNNTQVCSTIQCFRKQQSRVINLLENFQSSLREQLSTMIPAIRSGSLASNEIDDLFKEITDSPFSTNALTNLLKGMEQEIRAVTLCLKSINTINMASSDELESLGYEFDHILVFELRLLGSDREASIDRMDDYLQSKKTSSINSSSKVAPWYKDGSKKRAIQLKAKAFKEFAQLNSSRKDVTFAVSVNDEPPSSGQEGATMIRLYADESPMEFDPPSKPINLAVTLSAPNQVTLTWSKPKLGYTSITSYTVNYHSLKTPSAPEWVHIKTTGVVESLAVPGLLSDSQYEFTVQAECKIGLSPSSDSTIFTVPSAGINQPSVLSQTTEALHVSAASANSITSSPKIEHNPYALVPVEEHLKPVSSAPMGSQLPLSTARPQVNPGSFNLGLFTMSPHSQTSELLGATEYPSETQLQPRALFPTQMWPPAYGDRSQFYGHGSAEPSFHSPLGTYANSMPASARRVPVSESLDEDKWNILSENPHLSIPLVVNITHKSVELKWKKPENVQIEVESYTLYYYRAKDPDNNLKRVQIDGGKESFTLQGLTHETRYVFKLHVKLSGGLSLESKETDVIETLPYLPEKIRSVSKLIKKKTNEHPAIYELKKVKSIEDKEKRVAKYEVGKPSADHRDREKVLMVVGATGAGKTTLINGIANYMYGVQWEDDFRFVLVSNEPSKKSQAHSQTSWITAYTLYRHADSPIDYTLTIIDTPGFGDTEGIERDKKIVNQIKDFFSIKPPHGIDVLHGIGFVAQASLARLSQSQRYIFDSILSIYGRDVASNIFMMTTFADGQLPPVLEAIKVAKIPHQAFFKFNNSALFVTGEEGGFDAMFWKMGVKSFLNFFREFEKAESRSLQLTREVLSERESLEIVLKELQPQIHAGLTKMDELQNVVQALQRNKALIEQNKDFEFKVKVTKQKKVDTPRGRYTTNCLNCNYTCHKECKIAENEKKHGCWAMDGNGDCRICPDNCIWSKHVNNPYIFVLYEEYEIRTSKELKERYNTAKEGESSAEVMITNITGELEYLEDSVLKMVDKARRSLMRLDEIALKPNPLSEVDYIDKLITSEELQKQPGWLERIGAYKQVRKRAQLVRQIKTQDPTAAVGGGPIFLSYIGEGSGPVYSTATIEVISRKQQKKKSSYIPSYISRLWSGKTK